MAELKRIDEEFRASELATDGIPPKQPEGPKLVKGQEAETLDRGAAISKPMALFSEPEMRDFRSQWSKLQTGFVDEPRRTVEGADKHGSCGDAATRGRFCQRAVGIGKAVGQR